MGAILHIPSQPERSASSPGLGTRLPERCDPQSSEGKGKFTVTLDQNLEMMKSVHWLLLCSGGEPDLCNTYKYTRTHDTVGLGGVYSSCVTLAMREFSPCVSSEQSDTTLCC